ncbi:TrgA family protein [Rhodobacteraceae bacterium]|nr:TrgA family protein [Paracoccaceae bacterium]
MPTFGKLIAAIVFGALAYFVSDLLKPLLEPTEGTRVGMLSIVNGFIGMVMGWSLMGKAAGKNYRVSFGFGLTTLAVTVFWCALFWAGQKMLSRSVDLRYDGPMEALQQMGGIFLEYLRLVTAQEILIPAIVGAIFVSWLTEFFARRWG